MDHGTRLQLLALEEVGDGERLGPGRAGLDGLLLALLLLLLLGVHLSLVLLHGLLLELVDVLGDRHAVLFGLGGELALHHLYLLGGGLLAGLRRALGHALRRSLGAHGEGGSGERPRAARFVGQRLTFASAVVEREYVVGKWSMVKPHLQKDVRRRHFA